MALSKSRWKRLTESKHAHEHEAFEFLAAGLPDSEPNYLYTNFEFIADDGSINEVDALAITRAGIFLIEAKSRGGVITGNRHNWDWDASTAPAPPRVITVDSPLISTNSKSRKLADLLGKQKVFRNQRHPWIEPLIFLSAPRISVQLPASERMRICEREPREKSPGILAALLNGDYPGSAPVRHPIDRAIARNLNLALDQAGIRPAQSQRRVGDYVLRNLIEENELFSFQDFEAEHPTTHAQRRVRLYTTGPSRDATGQAVRDAIRRAALQEFRILESLDHPGILRAQEFYEHELGPAILFRRDTNEVRLDHFLRQQGSALPLHVRLDLIRQIADAVRYAHNHGVIHRTLSPRSILVLTTPENHLEVRLLNWQTSRLLAAASSGATHARSTTFHPRQFAEEASLIYLAPESLLDSHSRDPRADIFSLGALAYLIASGCPPASNPADLNETLAANKGLSVAAALDGASPGLRELIWNATRPDLLHRTENADVFLARLDDVWQELTDPNPAPVPSPLNAGPGDFLTLGQDTSRRLKVLNRLGGGSGAVALLVALVPSGQPSRQLVLKVARRDEDNARIRSEHATLRELRHPLIVEAEQAPLVFDDGRAGFLMEYVGKGTLAQQLKDVGRLSLEFLHRYGEDLLEVVQYLEAKGIGHRDLKPENIGIQVFGKNSQNRLKLFDFSLSDAPLDNVRAGTPPYLEPFLQLPGRRRWDTAAERYAAAVILYEMATGTIPRWGDGLSAPHLIDHDVTIESELIDAPIRETLTAFFRKSFRRDPRQRFDNAVDMWAAWHSAFLVDLPVQSRPSDPTALHAALSKVRPTTPVAQLGVSTRVQNILDRLSIVNAQELASQNPGYFASLRGVGNKTRTEIRDLIAELRAHLPQSPLPDRPATPLTPSANPDEPNAPLLALTIDELSSLLVPIESSPGGKVSRRVLAHFLELDDTSGGRPTWPTQTHIADRLHKSRAHISQILVKARERWRRTPDLTPVREALFEFLKAEGGVAEAGELARFLLASRSSSVPEPLASRRAAAIVRAALEAERPSEKCCFAERRTANGLLVAAVEPDALLLAERALDYAVQLGDTATKLAQAEPLPAPARVIETLRAIPTEIPALDDSRLLRLSAAVARVAVSPRQELYPVGLPAFRALKLAHSAVASLPSFSPQDLVARVRERYPEASPLPPRPELDILVRDAGLAFDWNDAQSAWLAKAPSTTESSTTFHRNDTIHDASMFGEGKSSPPLELPPHIEAARQFERRLHAAWTSPSYLVLATEPRIDRLRSAVTNIRSQFTMATFDCEAEMLAALRAEVVDKRIRWELILSADQEKPDTLPGRNVRKLAAAAARKVADKLRHRTRPTLLLYPGLLARYGQLNILDELQDNLGATSLWVLVGSDGRGTPPSSEKQTIPARPSQWAWIPDAWLKNEEELQKFRRPS